MNWSATNSFQENSLFQTRHFFSRHIHARGKGTLQTRHCLLRHKHDRIKWFFQTRYFSSCHKRDRENGPRHACKQCGENVSQNALWMTLLPSKIHCCCLRISNKKNHGLLMQPLTIIKLMVSTVIFRSAAWRWKRNIKSGVHRCPWRLNFVRWTLVFVDPSLVLRILKCLRDFWKICAPLC